MNLIKTGFLLSIIPIIAACSSITSTSDNDVIPENENDTLIKGKTTTNIIIIESDLPGYETMPPDGVRDFPENTKISNIIESLPAKSHARVIYNEKYDDTTIKNEICISERTKDSPFCAESLNLEQNVFENKFGNVDARLRYDLIFRKKQFDANYTYYKDYYVYKYSDARTGEYTYNNYYTPTVFTSKFDKKSYIVIISFKKK